MKTCSMCHAELPDELFSKNQQSRDGLRPNCKACSAAARREYTQTHKQEIYKRNNEYHKTENGKASKYKSYLKYKYGITLEHYNRLLESQNGCCAICGTQQSELTRKLYVDHDHETGKVRGLLCKQCNVFLGIAKDSVVFLDHAREYLTTNG